MSDIEAIVNKNHDERSHDRVRSASHKRILRLRKLHKEICVSALIAICAVLCGCVGALHTLLATIISVTSTMFGCFVLGQYVEARKRRQE